MVLNPKRYGLSQRKPGLFWIIFHSLRKVFVIRMWSKGKKFLKVYIGT